MTSNYENVHQEIYEEDTLEKDINVARKERVPKGPWGSQFGDQQDPSWVHRDTRVVPIIETDEYLEYQLPFGWKKVGKKRKNDYLNEKWDFYIYTPRSEQLRSNLEISSYLDRHPDTKCDRKVTNTSRPLYFNSWETRLKAKQISTASVGGIGGAGDAMAPKTVRIPKLSDLPPVLCSGSNSPKLPTDKGQLISKCPFGVFKSTKKSTNFL